MDSYNFNISDFNNTTKHLSVLERCIFRELIDIYYLTQKPLPLNTESIERKVYVESIHDRKALNFVLSQFFDRTSVGYVNKRIERDIAKHHLAQEKPKATVLSTPTNDLVNKVVNEFEQIWEQYGKKGNRKTSFERFQRLSKKKRALMKEHLPQYVLSTPNKQYRKNLESYINLECWNDEILINNNNFVPRFHVNNYNNVRQFDCF